MGSRERERLEHYARGVGGGDPVVARIVRKMYGESEPEQVAPAGFYVVQFHYLGTMATSPRLSTVEEARAYGEEGPRVILALWPDMSVTAVEALATDTDGVRIRADYETHWAAS